MERYVLQNDEIRCVRALVDKVASTGGCVDDEAFLQEVTIRAHELPRRLRTTLAEYRLSERSAVLVIAGYPIDQARIGPTPTHWKERQTPSPALREEIWLLLCGALLGDAIGWSTQQQGHVMHDVLPVRAHAQEQLGTGSEQLLWWHTEDAFHELRGDYIGLFCLRNPDGVATTICSVEDLPLDTLDLDRLFEPQYTIRPDESHLRKHDAGAPTGNGRDAAFARIEAMMHAPARVAVLSGARDAPYLRCDPYFMDPVPDDAAQRAMEGLIASIDTRLRDFVLQPGDLCLIDNYRAVHGRRAFSARYDGWDRWLKRINITRDLRKSRGARGRASSRVIA